ncbi:MAG: nucleotidyl transferase AbiEii/AbiGii toxin family protein [Deltaproteobacteria bacterium]|nr:nucleotidyl transferase AbiEii/AbiGii toxin family protein [Deltaproteobacteria bacterium]
MDQFVRLSGDERRLYFVQTAERMQLSPQIIEKDFWVCWTLRELFALPDIGSMLIFKGGTSLSKAYRLIERFSEDVDVSMDRAGLGFDDEASDPEAVISGKERRRRIDRIKEACQEKIVDELRPMMFKTIEAALGNAQGWLLTVDEDDPDRQTLLYAYPSSLPETTGAYIRPAVKIEMGARSDHWPSEQVRIAPYVAEQFPVAFETTDFIVKVLAAERTFWEKATLLHAEYHRPPDKEIPLRLSRHYYDTSRLILSGIGEKATGHLELLQRVVEHKKVFFPSGWAYYDEAIRGSLRVTPHPGRIRQIEEDYDKMREMFFAEPPVFAEVLRILEEWETHFNQGA